MPKRVAEQLIADMRKVTTKIVESYLAQERAQKDMTIALLELSKLQRELEYAQNG